jgi:branched-chain amino acid transport system substrate-binding protein
MGGQMKLKLPAAFTCLVLAGLLPGCQSTEPTPPNPSTPSAIPTSLATPTASDPASETTGVKADEILLASCSAQTGPAKSLGIGTVTGARAYLNYINDQGGVHGRKIKLNVYDDGYDPAKTVGCFDKLQADGAFAGAFFVGTPTAAKYVSLAEVRKIPIVGLFTGAQLLHDPFRPRVISVRASYFDETAEQMKNVVKSLGYKKVAVIYQDDAFGAAVLEGTRRALESLGLKPSGFGSFPRNTLDVERAINEVRAEEPDAVVLVGAYAPVAEIVKQSHKNGWRPLFLTVSFVGTAAFIKAAGPDADGTVITQVVPPPNRTDLPTVALYHKCMSRYFPQEALDFVSLEGFVDAMVVVEGLKRAGPALTRSGFVKALESIRDFDMGLGPTLRLDYGPDDHKGFNQVYSSFIVHGKPEILAEGWPEVKKTLHAR